MKFEKGEYNNEWQRVDNDSGGKHAEMKMLEKVEEVIQQQTTKRKKSLKELKLKIQLSYSPCSEDGHKCADKLIEFKNKMKNKQIYVDILIDFANFYKYYQAEFRNGLINMVVVGIKLGVFNGKEDWASFLDGVSVVNEVKRECLEIAARNERLKRENDDVENMKTINDEAKAIEICNFFASN